MCAEHENINAVELYENEWKIFEDTYWSERQRRGRINKPRMEWLVHATLQSERQREIDLSRLYNEYRDYVSKDLPSQRADLQVKRLKQYASQYKELVGGLAQPHLTLWTSHRSL